MKKLLRILLISIALITSVPVYANAAPVGYKEVKLTKKNAKKYFSLIKIKEKDVFGDYDGYYFFLYSKLRKKGYFIYKDSFALKLAYKHKYKQRIGKRWIKFTQKGTDTVSDLHESTAGGGLPSYNYKYAKISISKIKKAKGTLVFVEPNNVKGIKKVGDHLYHIILKYPYDSDTYTMDHWDQEKGEYVFDYYFIPRYSADLNRYQD